MDNYSQNYQGQPAERGLFNSLEVDQSVKMSLAEAAKWAKFMGIIGMIMVALMVLGGIGMIAMGSLLLGETSGMQGIPFSPAVLGVAYFVIALLYFYPTWTLLKFGTQTRSGIKAENQALFSQGLRNLMNCFKFVGILTIIIIAIYVLVIIAVAVGAGIGGMN